MKTVQEHPPLRSIGDIERESVELTLDAIALNPTFPAANLLAEIIGRADTEFLGELDTVLRAKHFLRLIRSERSKDRRKKLEAAWLTPQLRESALALPARVPIGDGKTVGRNEIQFVHTGLYLKFLNQEGRDRKEKDVRRAAIETIRKLWPRSKQRALPMTLAEVDSIKAKKAGLA